MRYALVALAIVALLVVISRRDVSQAGGYFTVTVRTVNLKPAAATDNGAAVSEAGTLVDVSHTKQGSLSDVVTISETSTSSDVRRANASDAVTTSETATRSDIRRPTRIDTGAVVSEVNALTRVTPAPTSTPVGPAKPYMGAYPIDSTSASYNSWLGCTPKLAAAYNFQQNDWSGNVDWARDGAAKFPAGTPVVLSLAIYPSKYTSGDAGMLALTSGVGDSFMTAQAQGILAGDPLTPDGNIYIRIFWETGIATGNWNGASVANWVAGYQHVANIFHAVSNKFKMVWDLEPQSLANNAAFQAYYPGDQYVDVVGQDDYFGASVAPSWAYAISSPWGLPDMAAFAASHGKPISIDEWGISADTPALATDLINFLKANNGVFALYFDADWAQFPDYLDSNRYPNFGAVYKAQACN